MDDTDSQLFEITDCGPSRIIRGRIERPRGHANSRERLPHVILLHGFKGFMDWGFFPDISRRIARRGMIAVRFNMSGSGIGRDLETFSDLEAFAHNTYSSELEDLERVRAWIAQSAAAGAFTEIDASRAALLGHSRGGGIALLHAAEHPELRSVVTWAAIANVDRFDDATKAQWRAQGFVVIHNARTSDDLRLDLDVLDDVEANREGLDIVAACRRMRVPTLLIHGLADEAVPFADLVTLAAALDPKLRSTLAIEGAGHTFGIRHPMITEPNAASNAPDRSPRSPSTSAWEQVADASLAMLERHWT